MVDTVYNLAKAEWAPWIVGCAAIGVALILIAALWADECCRRNANKWTKGDAE